jgi:hypothetical protein
MSDYHVKIDKVEGSVFAIGKNATAQGPISSDSGYRQLEQLLTDLLGFLSRCSDTANGIAEICDLADDAQRELQRAQPDRHRISRLAKRMQTIVEKVGSGVIGIGVVADTVTKIVEVVGHW